MAQPPVPAHVCPGCGANNPAYATFCHDCGEPLIGAGQVAPRRSGSPPPERVRARRWEVWIGLALLVGVLGYALLDWAHSEAQVRQYRAGEQAVAARHWDEAVAAFGALGTYRDAPRRHTAAAAQMQARDIAYQSGLTAADHHNVIAAYRAFSQTLAIEPDYRDAPARFATAQAEAPHAALADTIYRRVSGGPPGLYLYQAEGGDLWLPGSDGGSTVRAMGVHEGPLVYDGPLPGATPYPATPSTSSDFYNIPQLDADRRLLMVDSAALQAGTQTTAITLPPALGAYGLLLANNQILWDPVGSDTSLNFTLGYVQGIVVDKARIYDLSTGQSSNLSQPGAEDYVLLDPGAMVWQQHWLLCRYGFPGLLPKESSLYLLGDAGGLPQPVAQVVGVVYEAHLSPDGNYAVYKSSAAEQGQPGGTLDLGLIDLRDPAHPIRIIESLPLGSSEDTSGLQFQFVPGTGPPRVVIRRVVSSDQPPSRVQIDLWDGATGTSRHLWEGLLGSLRAGAGYTREVYWLAPDGHSLTITVPNRDGTAHLLWLALDGARPARELPLPTGTIEWWHPVFPGPHESDEYLLYYIVNRQHSESTRYDTLLYGVPAQDPIPPPELLVTLTTGANAFTDFLQLPTGLFAFRGADDTMQLRTLDGSLKLPALPGIDQVVPRLSAPLYPTLLYPFGY